MSQIDFKTQGIYGDDNMPDLPEAQMRIIGTRISPELDLSPALEEIKTIRSGKLFYYATPEEDLEIKFEVSFEDGERWLEVENNIIPNVEVLNEDPKIKVKYNIISEINQIVRKETAKVHQISIVLSNRETEEWSITENQLEWEGQ